MKTFPTLASLSLCTALLPLAASAQSGTRVSAQGFLSPESFTLVDGVDDLRVVKLYDNGNVASSSHILIEGLVPIEAGSSVVTSNYSGINLESEAITDVGRLYFTLPEGASASDVASSPIVGIVARSGAWSGDPEPTTLGGAVGSLRLNRSAGSLDVSLSKSGTTYRGTAPYARVDDSTIELQPFSLSSEGGAELAFYGTQMHHFNAEFSGILESSGGNPDYDEQMYALTFRGLTDYDGDGIPDLTDTSQGDWSLAADGWKFDEALYWVEDRGDQWGWSYNTGYVWTGQYPWLYVHNFGYIRYIRRDGQYAWFWDNSTGEYIYTGEGYAGWFFRPPYDQNSADRFF